MIKPWDILSRRPLLSNRIFQLTARVSPSPKNGVEHEFYVLETPDWVNVVPLTEEGEVIMVRQFRHGRRDVTLEIPGGMVDPEDGDPAAAAGRELLEETGYAAGSIRHLGSVAPNPALLSNQCHSYLATDLVYRGPQQLDGAEDIEVVLHPLARIPELIATGAITHSLVVVAFTYLMGLIPPDPGG